MDGFRGWICARWHEVRARRLWITALYFASVGGSLAVSRTGQTVVAVCVVTASVFVFGVVWAVTRPDPAQSSLPWSTLLSVMLLGLALLSFELWRAQHQWVGYVAVALAYFGFAGMVARFRGRAHAVGFGRTLVVLGVVAVYTGLMLLGRLSGPWAELSLGVGAMLLLAGTDLSVPEVLEAEVPNPIGSVAPRAAILLVGGVAVAAGITLGWLVGTLASGLVVVLAVALLSLAYVSRSPVDVVVVVAIVALFGATRPEVDPPGPDSSPKPSVLLSLGDSYMSGEGAKTFYTGTDEASGNQCRRAPTAYAARSGAARIGFTSTVFLACSGAVASEIYRNTQSGTTGPQLAQYQVLGRPPAKLVVVGIGGNDAGFSHIGTSCLAPGACGREMTRLFLDNLPVVEKNIEAALAQVHAAVPGVPVVAVPYPAPFAVGGSCDGILLSPTERKFLSTFLDDLDQEMNRAAAASHTYYLAAMQQSLARANLQLCAKHPTVHHCPGGFSATHGLNFVHLQSVAGYATQRFNPANWVHDSLHPNACGHDAEFKVFADWYERMNSSLQATPTFAAVAPPPGVRAAEATCRLANSPQADAAAQAAKPVKTCEAKANAWALRQVGGAGLYVVALLLLLAASLGWIWRLALLRCGPARERVFTGGTTLVLAAVVVVICTR